MIDELKENERMMADNLIKKGLEKASEALGSILKSPISIGEVDYGKSTFGEEGGLDESERTHLLTTEIIGELKGVCHLIFTEEEVDKMNKACLPEEVLNSKDPESRMMKMEFLTELDNMVAAAVITQFANQLDSMIYGHVPSLQVMKSEKVMEYLEAESEKFDTVIHFKATFKGDDLNIAPKFTWMIQDSFVNKIKELSA